jgi:hypothetical protein
VAATCTHTTYTRISRSNLLLAPRTHRNQTWPPKGPASRLRMRLNTHGQKRSTDNAGAFADDAKAADDALEEEKGRTGGRRGRG